MLFGFTICFSVTLVVFFGDCYCRSAKCSMVAVVHRRTWSFQESRFLPIRIRFLLNLLLAISVLLFFLCRYLAGNCSLQPSLFFPFSVYWFSFSSFLSSIARNVTDVAYVLVLGLAERAWEKRLTAAGAATSSGTSTGRKTQGSAASSTITLKLKTDDAAAAAAGLMASELPIKKRRPRAPPAAHNYCPPTKPS